MIRIGLIQTCTGIDANANAAALAADVRALAARGAKLVFTPEMSGLLDRNSRRLRAAAMPEASEPTLAAIRAAASDCGVTVALGSLAVRDGAQLRNRSLLIAPDGGIVARYDKIHLFDVTLPDGTRYHESATFGAGTDSVAVQLPDVCLGLTICYDLRFPALHAALARAGAQIIAQPSSFTVPTGAAHWHVLLRARAIETGAFVVAAAQTGTHADGRETYGHSLVVNPWGEVLLDMGTAPGTAIVDLDLDEVAAARARIPTLSNARPIAAARLVRLPEQAPA